MKPSLLCVVCVTLPGVWAASAKSAPAPSVRIQAAEGGVRLSVRDGDGWRPVLSAHPGRSQGAVVETLALPVASSDAGGVRLRGPALPDGSGTVETRITPNGNAGGVRVVSHLRLSRPVPVEAVRARWVFTPGGQPTRPDFTWTPNLRPNPDEVIGQHAFRSPAVVAQLGRTSAVLLPDVDALNTAWRQLPGTLNLDVTSPEGATLEYTLQEHVPVRHVFWRHEPGSTATLGPGTVTLAYDILLSADTEPRMGYRRAARWWWDRQGRRHLSDVLPQAVPWGVYARTGIDRYMLPVAWRETTMGGETVGGVSMGSLASSDATWFNDWFNDLRSAYGTYLWGKWMNRPDVVQKSRQTRQLLLNSPQPNGLFPVIYEWRTQRWLGSSGPGVGGGPDIYHTADCAWAAYWLLMWHEDLERHPQSVAFARRLGDFLVEAQRPNGDIPAYFSMQTMQPTGRLENGAESAASGMFLAFLGRVTGDARYTLAARRVAEYVRNEIWPRNRWFDYETFYSCSYKPESYYDPITDQNPQNTLSIHWATEMFRQLYLTSRRPEDLRDGEAMLDYLNLYQQVWSPSFLTFEGYGGYGVQNTDAEWNDARQAQFACTNLDFHALTGKREYMERAIAGMRAGFATVYMPENQFVSPRTYAKSPLGFADENYGHGGVDAPAGPTSWDWGTGSALAAVAYARKRYGDVWVDWDQGRAFGINGVVATLKGNDLRLASSTQTLPILAVRGTGRKTPATVRVNGVERTVSGAEWRAGWTARPDAQYRLRHRPPAYVAADAARVPLEVWPRSQGGTLRISYETWSNGQRQGGGEQTVKPGADGRAVFAVEPERFTSGAQTLRYRVAGGPAFQTRVLNFGDETPVWAASLAGDDALRGWSVETPAPGARVDIGANGVTFSLPGERSYDQWVDQDNAPRLMRAVPDGNWSYTVRMSTRGLPPGGLYQAGLTVHFGGDDYVFFGPYGGPLVTLERSGRNGLSTMPLKAPDGEVTLRARKVGRTVWFDWGTSDGWSALTPVEAPDGPLRVGIVAKTWAPLPVRATFLEARMARLP